ncbi:hypothetical protein OAF42_03645 [Planctomicrobium sp.]|nr:hypothetical protein [Planctomicrobium sp.]MBT5020634.1 hypothetical protein [Planctomicrobium sp.]MDB4733517.1 hypothetical protein [Planctomicrobium sp.]
MLQQMKKHGVTSNQLIPVRYLLNVLSEHSSALQEIFSGAVNTHPLLSAAKR